ncbi:MAG: SDR family oxidoreductase [Acidimicrobiales bacterium]
MILDRFRLTDRVAVVTAAGKGIGAASAVALAQAGADVVIAARTPEDLESVAKRVAEAGRRAETVAIDLSDPPAAASLAQVALESFGRLDVIVNNLGGWMPRPILEVTPGHLERAFRFNVATAHSLVRAGVPVMLAGDGGSIINISSFAASVGARGMVAYATAKAALSHYTRSAAAELGPKIRVNAIGVGTVATSSVELVIQDDTARSLIERTTSLRRPGQPEEIAAAVVFLAAQSGSYVTGTVLHVDGGAQAYQLDLGLPDL